MLDLVGIVFSSLMMLFVIIRAVQLDGSRPWFEVLSRQEDEPGPEAGRRGRRGAPGSPSAGAPRAGSGVASRAGAASGGRARTAALRHPRG